MSDLEIRGLAKEFAGPAGSLPILRGLDLSLDRGTALAITGPSGSGKSTLLYIVGGLEPPSSGTVRVLGIDPWTLAPKELARFRNQRIGFVFQDHHLLPQLTVIENVLVPALAGTGAGAAERDRAAALLSRVGLGDRLLHRPGQLSGGERQRVAICRALITAPPVILADEPTGNLDGQTAQAVGSLLLELAAEHNVLLIAVTHSLELAGRFRERRVLREGRLVEA
jgi:lipoprotein-releasing system ATP-binding protein